MNIAKITENSPYVLFTYVSFGILTFVFLIQNETKNNTKNYSEITKINN